jgi:hypothetical protein
VASSGFAKSYSAMIFLRNQELLEKLYKNIKRLSISNRNYVFHIMCAVAPFFQLPPILKPRLLHWQRPQPYHIHPRASQGNRILWLQTTSKIFLTDGNPFLWDVICFPSSISDIFTVGIYMMTVSIDIAYQSSVRSIRIPVIFYFWSSTID